MTFSLLAADPATGQFGAAIASRFLAVGSYCLYLDPVGGGVVSQGLANPILGLEGRAALSLGQPPAGILDHLLSQDGQRANRQTHLMTPAGTFASETGSNCGPWSGTLAGDNLSIAGNLLSGGDVLEAMKSAFENTSDKALTPRLLAALDAGTRAGGDWRGMQAAAIQVFAGEVYPWVDLRVDDHERPVDELNRLYRRHLEADVQQVRATMARRTLESDGPEYPPIGDLSATLETNEERRQRGDPE